MLTPNGIHTGLLPASCMSIDWREIIIGSVTDKNTYEIYLEKRIRNFKEYETEIGVNMLTPNGIHTGLLPASCISTDWREIFIGSVTDKNTHDIYLKNQINFILLLTCSYCKYANQFQFAVVISVRIFDIIDFGDYWYFIYAHFYFINKYQNLFL